MDLENNQWDEIFRREGHVFEQPEQTVVDFVSLLKENHCQNVLDLGCGSGRHLVYLAQQGLHAWGLDKSRTGLQLTREWLAKEHLHADLLLADIWQPLPFQDGALDSVMSVRVIHHARLAIVRRTAEEISRVLKKEGLLLVMVPAKKKSEGENIEIEPDTFVPMSGWEKGLPHHIFTPEGLSALFPKFTVINLSTIDESVITLVALKTR